jgi:hypothetical protein
MSGLLRRIKRSRTAGAGEAPPEGQAASPDGEPPTAGAPADSPVPPSATPTSTPTAELPAAEATAEQPAADPDAPEPLIGDAQATEPEAAGTPLAEPQPAQPAEPAPVPEVPAGQEPVELSVRAPVGRRGRLRRRLRYLRRARELMLRDLGGLFYEIHRTGGGRVDAYATVVNAKIERISGVDAEARALETALTAPRGESIVFEPGVGGTCAVCGELYGSSARFCSNCGTATGSGVHAPAAPAMPAPPPMPPAPPREPEPEPEAEAEPEAQGEQPPDGDEQPTRALDPEPTADEDPPPPQEHQGESGPEQPGGDSRPPADDPPGDRTERLDARNGTGVEQHAPAGPVAARESGS